MISIPWSIKNNLIGDDKAFPAFHRGSNGGGGAVGFNINKNHHSRHRTYRSSLFAGNGIATDYSWREEQFEIDITVPVPAGTRGKDLKFKATPSSVELRLVTDGDENGKILLDGK
eukprot:11327698-Ditylum_brightwellii.AAC.1